MNSKMKYSVNSQGSVIGLEVETSNGTQAISIETVKELPKNFRGFRTKSKWKPLYDFIGQSKKGQLHIFTADSDMVAKRMRGALLRFFDSKNLRCFMDDSKTQVAVEILVDQPERRPIRKY